MSAVSADALIYLRSLVRIGGIESAARILNVSTERLAVYLASVDA